MMRGMIGVLALCVARASAAKLGEKQLVETAHPMLKKAFAAQGRLSAADFQAAAATAWEPPKRAAPRSGASRLGGFNDDRTEADCEEYLHSGDACYDGTYVGDDDTVLGFPSPPGACATCGYFPEDDLPPPEEGFVDCQTCADDTYTLYVMFDDCTGLCAAPDTVDTLAGLGFATLDDSACVAITACYEDDFGISGYATDGTNARYVDDGGSYSYSYSYDGDEAVWGCDADNNVILSSDCDCCDCGLTFIAESIAELQEYVNDCEGVGDVAAYSCDDYVLKLDFCDYPDEYTTYTPTCGSDDYVPEDPDCVVCADSDTWHKVGATSKDCAWVGRKPDTRCVAKGTEEGHMAKIEAWYACGASCWGCHSDSESWFKRGSPAKTCAWVGAYPEKRCSVKGDDKTLASDACPTSCE